MPADNTPAAQHPAARRLPPTALLTRTPRDPHTRHPLPSCRKAEGEYPRERRHLSFRTALIRPNPPPPAPSLTRSWCYDSTSCKKRSPDQRSSKNYAASYAADGIFASSEARLRDANLVYVAYCTSDAYLGNGTLSDFGFHFAGRAVVRAVFEDLVAEQGLGATAGAQVLYGGCSAGARGALFNADAVRAQLDAALGSRLARFGALLDSMFYVDIEPYDTTLPSLMSITAQATEMTGALDGVMPGCLEAYPAPADHWKCFYGMYALPFIQADYIMNSCEYPI